MAGNYFFNFRKMAYFKGKKPDGCILCHVKNNNPEVENLTVYNDDLFCVSVNLYPYNPGHLIIFPKRHIKDIRNFSEEENEILIKIKYRLLDILDSLYSPAGYNIGYNNWKYESVSLYTRKRCQKIC